MTCFSIVIPTYNRAGMVKKTVQSLLAQSCGDMEVIVVDDGGTDNTKELLQELNDSRIKYFWKENGERGAARNYGVMKSTGRYINFFDSDDIALPNHLEEALKLIKKKDSPAFFHLGYAWADESGKIFKYSASYQSDTLNEILFSGNTLSCNGVFLRREIAQAFPFSEDRNFIFMEDYLLWLQIGAQYTLDYSNVTTSLIVEHADRSIKKFDDKVYKYGFSVFLQQLELLSRKSGIIRARRKSIRAFANLALAYIYSAHNKFKWRSIRHIFIALFTNLLCSLKNSLLWVSIKNILTKWRHEL